MPPPHLPAWFESRSWLGDFQTPLLIQRSRLGKLGEFSVREVDYSVNLLAIPVLLQKLRRAGRKFAAASPTSPPESMPQSRPIEEELQSARYENHSKTKAPQTENSSPHALPDTGEVMPPFILPPLHLPKLPAVNPPKPSSKLGLADILPHRLFPTLFPPAPSSFVSDLPPLSQARSASAESFQSGCPKATAELYIKIYDKNGEQLREGRVFARECESSHWQTLSLARTLEDSSAAYVEVGISATSGSVYFDDLRIVADDLPRLQVVSMTDYYPYGHLLRQQIDSSHHAPRHDYQGDFAEKDEETGWNSFQLRQYDAVLGRWVVMDPYRVGFSPYIGMANSPISSVDPDGGKTDDPTKGFKGVVLDEVTVKASRIGRGFDMGFLSRIGTTSGWSNVGLGFSELSLGSESFRQFLASKDGLLSSSKLKNISKFSKFGGWATAGISTATDFIKTSFLFYNRSPKASQELEKSKVNFAFTLVGLRGGSIGIVTSSVYFAGSQYAQSAKNPYGLWSLVGHQYKKDKSVFNLYWHKRDSFFNNVRRTFPLSGH